MPPSRGFLDGKAFSALLSPARPLLTAALRGVRMCAGRVSWLTAVDGAGSEVANDEVDCALEGMEKKVVGAIIVGGTTL